MLKIMCQGRDQKNFSFTYTIQLTFPGLNLFSIRLVLETPCFLAYEGITFNDAFSLPRSGMRYRHAGQSPKAANTWDYNYTVGKHRNFDGKE